MCDPDPHPPVKDGGSKYLPYRCLYCSHGNMWVVSTLCCRFAISLPTMRPFVCCRATAYINSERVFPDEERLKVNTGLISIHLSCARQVKESVSHAVLMGLIFLTEVPSSNEALQDFSLLSKKTCLRVGEPIAMTFLSPSSLPVVSLSCLFNPLIWSLITTWWGGKENCRSRRNTDFDLAVKSYVYFAGSGKRLTAFARHWMCKLKTTGSDSLLNWTQIFRMLYFIILTSKDLMWL